MRRAGPFGSRLSHCLEAWLDLNLYTHLPWLGLIMAAAILRAGG